MRSTPRTRRNITHRDLKPPNILVTKQGIKLLDFGLAKVAPAVRADEATMTMALTGKNEIVGSLLYMSPEQLQSKNADARSDIFSFGLVLYEMLTGKRAFDGSSPASVIAAILERPAPSIGGVAPPALDRGPNLSSEGPRSANSDGARRAPQVAVRVGGNSGGTDFRGTLKADRSQGPSMPSRLSSDSTSRRSSGSACPSSDSRVSESRSGTAW